MLDLGYFQNSGNVSTQTFTNAGSWVTWLKPRGAKFVNILCIGAGSGGGGGFLAAAGNKSGGQGGSSGGCVRLQLQASLLPDLLYIQTGVGGVGGIGGNPSTAGSSATKSYVCLIPDTSSASNIVCTSGAVASTGGTGGSTITATGGTAETIATPANAIFLNLGTFLAVAGNGGGAGGLTSGANITTTSFLSGGTGGGGTTVGGSFAAADPFPAFTAAAINTNGASGIALYKPILGFTPGLGAGGGTTGGNGGNGAYSCGGGGGGAGTTSAGNGGRGGDGIIIITTSF
jgi:hypothetical protein